MKKIKIWFLLSFGAVPFQKGSYMYQYVEKYTFGTNMHLCDTNMYFWGTNIAILEKRTAPVPKATVHI